MTPSPLLARLLVRSGIARLLPWVQRAMDGGAEYLRFYSDRLLGSPLGDLPHLAAYLGEAGPDVVDLADGCPRFDLFPSGTTKLPADRRGWPVPGGMPELRAAVSAKLLQDNRLAFSPADEILITSGAHGAVQVIVDAFVNSGDRVVLPDPVSPLYPLAIKTRGGRISRVPMRVEEGRLRFRLHDLARQMRGARLLVLCTPCNPTGGVLAAEDLEQIAWWAERHDVLILSDEVFERFCFEADHVSPATIARMHHRTLTVGSVSKSHALASARVGWIAGQKHLLRACAATAAVRCPFVPTLCQQQALAALRSDPGAFDLIHEKIDARRRYAVERLCALGLKATCPAAGYFLWVPVPEAWRSGQAMAEALMQSKRVRVMPGELFGPAGAKHIRLSVAVDDAVLQTALDRLAGEMNVRAAA